MTTFVTTHDVSHNQTAYPAGTPITLDDHNPDDAAAIAHLRANKAIALAVELQAAEDTQAQLDRKEQELAELRAELQAAREAAAASPALPPVAASPSGKGKAAAATPTDGAQPDAQP